MKYQTNGTFLDATISLNSTIFVVEEVALFICLINLHSSMLSEKII